MTQAEQPPIIGQGEIVGPTRDDGWPSAFYSLRCDLCGATWAGPEGETCWWCEQRLEWQQKAQESMDRSRLRDYLDRLSDGDTAALKPALDVALRVPNGSRLLARTLVKLLEAA